MIVYKGNPVIHTIVLHNTAVSRSRQTLQFDAVNNHHRRKWGDLSEMGFYTGYNFFCEPTGKRTQTRKVGEETIAQIGNNCDVSTRCGMVSYCWAGYFKVEKPTQFQKDDFVAFVREVQRKFPKVVLKQHKDVYPARTCAELSDAELQAYISDPIKKETKDQTITRLEASVETLTKQNTTLIGMVNTLIKIITK